tara:strand:- start:345 stop:623 length:279 start_codon:yes stop_codon:yes gene_type:complete
MMAVIVLKAGVEVALLLMVSRSLVFAMSMGRHAENPVHRLLLTLTAPIDSVARRLSPRLLLDRHMGLVSFCLLVWAWVALVLAKAWLAGQPL